MPPGDRVDELGGDPYAVLRALYAAFQDVLHSELLAYLLHLHSLTLVSEGGVLGDDEEVAESGQLGNHILRETVGEVLLVGVAA